MSKQWKNLPCWLRRPSVARGGGATRLFSLMKYKRGRAIKDAIDDHPPPSPPPHRHHHPIPRWLRARSICSGCKRQGQYPKNRTERKNVKRPGR